MSNELDRGSLKGKNVFDFVNDDSKSYPQTLSGTDANIWIVYYKDINTTFRVDKHTHKIVKLGKGKIPEFGNKLRKRDQEE